MNELIMMFLFELEIDKDVGKISKVEIKKICELTLNDEIKNARIDMYVEGRKQNVVTYGYDIYKKSTSLVKEIDINIQKIKSAPCSENLDELLLDLISRVELNRFCNMIRQTKEPYRHIPGYEPIILQFDQGFYEFKNIYLELAKFRFPQITYHFSKLSDEEMQQQREESLLTTTRAVFAIKSSEQLNKYVADVSALGVTEKNRSRINAVILEMLVCYDANKETHRFLLDSALRLASILIKYTPSGEEKDVYILNRYQIKARQNYKLSKNDKKEIQRIMKCKSEQKHIRLGAAILVGDSNASKSFFDALSENEVQQFIQLPIYRLWINAPVAANDNPGLFIKYEHSNNA